jgi:hypothetical protein
MSRIVVLLLLLLLTGLAIAIHSVRIPLYTRQYVQVRVGNPGRKLTLRLRWDHDTTYLYERGESYSFTFGASDEIFYLGDVKVRLPIVYGLEAPLLVSADGTVLQDDRRIDTSGSVTHHGSLGLGPGSFLWRYWTSYTISRHTLTLGSYDSLDVKTSRQDRIESSGPVDPSEVLRAAFRLRHVNDSLHVLRPNLASEFTYLPIDAYRALQRLLEQAESRGIYTLQADRARLKASIIMSSVQHPGVNNTFWLGVGLTYITTAYGSHERVIRMADSVEFEQTARIGDVTMGRLHLLDQHVFYEDKMHHVVRLETAFDGFPLIDSGQAPQGWLTLIALVMYIWWPLETYSMLYQWLLSGLSPHIKRITRHLEVLAQSAQAWVNGRPVLEEATTANGTITEDIPATVYEQPLNAGPIDWNVVPVMLFASRVICLVSAYVTLFGFQSVRFAEQLARMAFYDSRLGAALYYGMVAYSVLGVLAVSPYFIRRYPQAAYSLVSSALLTSVWLNQQPDTESLFFRLSFNLFFSTLLCLRLYEWAFALALRGADSVLSQHITAVGEFNTDAEFLTSENGFEADSKRIMQAVRQGAAQLNSAFEDSPTLPVTVMRKRTNASRINTLATDLRLRPYVLLSSSVQEPFCAGPGDLVIASVLGLVVLPLATAFLMILNVFPLIETSAPRHPLRIWLGLGYLFLVVMAVAFNRASGLILQVIREHTLATRRAIIGLYQKATTELQSNVQQQ